MIDVKIYFIIFAVNINLKIILYCGSKKGK